MITLDFRSLKPGVFHMHAENISISQSLYPLTHPWPHTTFTVCDKCNTIVYNGDDKLIR